MGSDMPIEPGFLQCFMHTSLHGKGLIFFEQHFIHCCIAVSGEKTPCYFAALLHPFKRCLYLTEPLLGSDMPKEPGFLQCCMHTLLHGKGVILF